MPRFFVNSMSNFVIQGGMVSFTLQDQAMRTEGGQPVARPPEDVSDVVMREQDFAQFLTFLNQHATAFEEQTGRKIGGGSAQPQQPQAAADGAQAPAPAPDGGGMKIRPRES